MRRAIVQEGEKVLKEFEEMISSADTGRVYREGSARSLSAIQMWENHLS